MTKDQALKHALEKFEYMNHVDSIFHGEFDFQINAIKKALAQQAEPVAYDKTELNCFAQDLYDQKMREGKRGHYESMFHVIHQCIKRVAPPLRQPEPVIDKSAAIRIATALGWTPPRQPLTIEKIDALYESTESVNWGRSFARAIEAAHGIKENK